MVGIGTLSYVSLARLRFKKQGMPFSVLRFPRASKYARIGLVAAIFVAAAIRLDVPAYFGREVTPGPHIMVIAIAKFSERGSSNYSLTEDLIARLKSELRGYDEMEILPVDEVVTEQQGSDVARRIAGEHKACIFVWGHCYAAAEHVSATIHLENIDVYLEKTRPSEDYYFDGTTAGSVFSKEVSAELAALPLFIAAIALANADNPSEALKRLQAIRRLDHWDGRIVSRAAVAHFESECYSELDLYDEAVERATEAIANAPKDWSNYFLRGNVFQDLKKYPAAVKDYDTALLLDPSNCYVLNNRATTKIWMAAYNDALQDLNAVVNLRPDLADAYNNRALIYRSLGDNEKALADFNKVLTIDSSHAAALFGRAQLNFVLGNYDTVIADATKLVQLRPDYKYGFVVRAAAYRKLNKSDLAERDENSVKTLSESFSGYLATDSSVNPDGYRRKWLDLAIRIDDMPVIARKGVSLLDADKYQEALEYFDSALKTNPDEPFLYYYRGLSNALLSRTDAANEDFTSTLGLTQREDVATMVAHLRCIMSVERSLILFDEAKPNEAVQNLDRALPACGSEPSLFMVRALCNTALSHREEAEKDLDTGTKVATTDEDRKDVMQMRKSLAADSAVLSQFGVKRSTKHGGK
jgi:tetratricopeptide (TPR) repeat protein